MISIVVAFDENRLIGRGNSIPWTIPKEDMKQFKERTTGHSVVMGRKTYDSIPSKFRPLPNRNNIVVTRSDAHTDNNGTVFVNSLEKAIEIGGKEVFIIGGGQIYREALEKNLADRIIASVLKGRFTGDVYFPEIPLEWKIKSIENFDDFQLQILEK